MLKEKSLILLIDGNSLMHRAFHALPPLTTRKTGEETGAIYGFTRMLLKMLSEFKPSHCAIAFDRPGPTFRHLKFKEYKAHRPPTPPELVIQFSRIRKLVTAFNIPILEMDSYEADDILGTLCNQASKRDIDSIIVTGDTDILQLVSHQVRMLTPGRTLNKIALYDESAVQGKYGLTPAQISDFKGLKGDASDNIPGVPGIGEKTATRLLQQFSNIEGIYQHIEEVSPDRIKQLLKMNKRQALESKELATIVINTPINIDFDACRTNDYDREKVKGIFRELEFFRLLDALPQNESGTQVESKVAEKGIYRVIDTIESLDNLLGELSSVSSFAITTALSSIIWGTPELTGLALSPSPGKAYYIPLKNDCNVLPRKQIIAHLKTLIENPNIAKIMYNAKQGILSLSDCGFQLINLTSDTMIAAHLVGEKSLDIRTLALSRLGIDTGAQDVALETTRMASAGENTSTTSRNICLQADITTRLNDELVEELKKQKLWKLYAEIEIPLIPILARMEKTGITLDTDIMREISRSMDEQLRYVKQEIYNQAGHEFNINSSQQLSIVLFKELQLPPSHKTKKGYSTNVSVLEGLRESHTIIKHILKYRSLSKLKSTYIDPLPALVNPKTGRLHTSFNQTGTATGRLSSSNPNMQNIPLRGEDGKRIRRAFISTPPWMLMAGDYSQIELRVLAHLSQDDYLLSAFKQDKDIHSSTAAEVFGVSLDQVTPEMRRVAKVVNFGVAYGMSDYGLMQATELSRREASHFIKAYFEKYRGVQEYITRTKQQAKERGYVKTLLGRRRYIPEITSPNYQTREAAERMAINMPMQGTAADITKMAMITVQKEIDQRGLCSKMLLQVHDELIFEVPPEEIEEMRGLIEKTMSEVIELSIPLKVNVKIGANWGEMK